MSCQKCGSQRVMSFGAKCSDMFHANIGENHYDGYVLRGANIGGGDYIEARLCLDCGQMQGQWPVDPIDDFETVDEDE